MDTLAVLLAGIGHRVPQHRHGQAGVFGVERDDRRESFERHIHRQIGGRGTRFCASGYSPVKVASSRRVRPDTWAGLKPDAAW